MSQQRSYDECILCGNQQMKIIVTLDDGAKRTKGGLSINDILEKSPLYDVDQISV